MNNTTSQLMEKEIEQGEDLGSEDIDLSKFDDSTDWQAEAKKIAQKAKEDGIKARERTKVLKEKLAALEKPAQPEQKSSDLDDGRKALWRSYANIQGSDEWAYVKEQMKKSGITDPEELSSNDYFKQGLERLRTSKSNADALDTRGNRGEQRSSQTSVEYWLAKGEHPPKELGSKLAQEYVQARRGQGSNAKVFYND